MEPLDDKQELNDILISESESKMTGSKKILLLGGAGTLLFMVAIFVVYTLNKGESAPEDELAALPPKSLQQTTLQPTPVDEPLFEQVPIKEQKSAEDKFEEIVKEIKEKKADPVPQAPAPKAAPAAPVAPSLPKAPAPKPAAAPTPAPAPQAPAVAAPAPAPTPAPSVPTVTPVTSVPAGYYVQVGAFFRFTPDKKFIETIQQNNLSYQLYKIQRDGKEITKVLIGPFSSRQDAVNVIGTIRSRINQQAFITKV